MAKQLNEANFYRARAIDMMKKAQSAQSERTRQVYLDLAPIWTERADSLQNTAQSMGATTSSPPGTPAAPDSSSSS